MKLQKLVLPELVKQNIGVLGMKPLANGLILQSNTVDATQCFALRSESSNERGDHWMRDRGEAAAGPENGADVQEDGRYAGKSTTGENEGHVAEREVGAV